jgi:hypothetical protein
MAEAHAARAERMALERAALLATTHGEADQATQRVSTFEGELVATRRARDVAEEKFLSLSSNADATVRRQEVVEEQCKRLVHELTLLSLRGPELCMTITSALP